MSYQSKHSYEFGLFRLDAGERLLLREGESVPLTPKAFDLLLALVEHDGHLLEKDELLKLVWPDTFVEEANLSYTISLIRKALGDGENGQKYIETVPKRGYRFVAHVREVAVERDEPLIQEISEAQNITEAKESVANRVPVAPAHPIPSAKRWMTRVKRSTLLAMAIIIVVGAGITLYKLLDLNRPIAPNRAMKFTRLTHTGKAICAAISQDGKYVAYVLEEAGRQSLWLRHTATNSDTQIVAPADSNYRGVSFSPDGNFIYYVRGKPRDPTGEFHDISGVLYKSSILGKGEKKLIEKVYNFFSLSPDGSRLAFVRQYPAEGKSAVLIANADGTGERELARRSGPTSFAPGGGLAWSPDSRIIACITMVRTPVLYRSMVGLRVEDGVETPITSHKWYGVMTDLEWLPDGSGLLVLGAERLGSSHQIWHLSYPGDKLRKVTDDLNDYADLSLTADPEAITTVRFDRLVNIWIASGGDVSRIKQISSGAGREDGVDGLVWTHDDRIVYRSCAIGGDNIWIMDAEGMGSKQLSFDDTANFNPTISPDGRYIVWVASPKGRRNIWRIDINGENPKQLTNGIGEWFPQCSPDGKWLVYASAGPSTLWRMPVDGGAPVKLTRRPSWAPSISPDGKLIAFNLLDEASGQWKIAVMPLEGGEPAKDFEILGGIYRPIRWTHNGRALAYPIYRGGVSNIWTQPLDGGPPKQLTDFRDGIIFNFAWSRDGKQLALSRGLINSDVVLISNFR